MMFVLTIGTIIAISAEPVEAKAIGVLMVCLASLYFQSKGRNHL